MQRACLCARVYARISLFLTRSDYFEGRAVDWCQRSSFHTFFFFPFVNIVVPLCCTILLCFSLTNVRVGAWCYDDVDYLKDIARIVLGENNKSTSL